MGTEAQLKRLSTVAQQIKAIDKDKLFRRTVGEESLAPVLTPWLESLNKKLDFALEQAPHVFDGYLSPVIDVFNNTYAHLNTQSARSNPEYITQKTNFINGLKNLDEQFNQYWPFLIATAVDTRGFLQDEGIKQEYTRTLAAMKEEAGETLKNVQTQANAIIEKAKELSDQIEKRARRTAQKISVEAAQTQFSNVQTQLMDQLKLWAVLGGLSFFAFVGLSVWFLNSAPPEEASWHAVYYAAIRITILSATGGLTVYFMRIFRAHLHMYQHNHHRQAVTNSIEAFVAAAETPEQRDLILAGLVSAVVSFGQSGLIEGEPDSVHPAKMIIDTAPRIVSSLTQKAPG